MSVESESIKLSFSYKMDSQDLKLVDHQFHDEVIWSIDGLEFNKWTTAVVYLEKNREYKVSFLQK